MRDAIHWSALSAALFLGVVLGAGGIAVIFVSTGIWCVLTVCLSWIWLEHTPPRKPPPVWFTAWWLYTGAGVGLMWVHGWFRWLWSMLS